MKILLQFVLFFYSLFFFVTPIFAKQLESEKVFQILFSEIAIQRGEILKAYNIYMTLSKLTKDYRMAERAMEIAINNNFIDLAISSAEEFYLLCPSKAAEIYITLLMYDEKWIRSIPLAKKLILNKNRNIFEKERLLINWNTIISKKEGNDLSKIAFYEIMKPIYQKVKNIDLLFSFSVAAEQTKHLDIMKKSLYIILKRNPNHISALNKLAYFYINHNTHLNLANSLLQKAYQIDPENSYTLKNIGLLHYYYFGKKEIGIEYLKSAFSKNPDSEIGAHLGEMYFLLNMFELAKNIWNQSEELDATNQILLSTFIRLNPKRTKILNFKEKKWNGKFSIVTLNLLDNISSKTMHGNFTLFHNQYYDLLDIKNKKNISLMKIEIKPSALIFITGELIYKTYDYNTFIKSYLGFSFPIYNLITWLNGYPMLNTPAKIFRDKNGYIEKLIQDFWKITYSRNENQEIFQIKLKQLNLQKKIEIQLLFDTNKE